VNIEEIEAKGVIEASGVTEEHLMKAKGLSIVIMRLEKTYGSNVSSLVSDAEVKNIKIMEMSSLRPACAAGTTVVTLEVAQP